MTIEQPARRALAAQCRRLMSELRAHARSLGTNDKELRESLYSAASALDDSADELEQEPVQHRKAA